MTPDAPLAGEAADQSVALHASPAFREAALGMAVLAPDFTILRVNPRLAESLGYRAEEMQDMPPERFTHPEDVPLVREIVARALATGEVPPPFLKRCLRKDGGTLLCELQLSRLPGVASGWLAQVTDVTELERARNLLERERRLFVGGPVVVFRWINAPGWPVEYVSPNLRAEFGWDPEELLSGRIPYADLVHPDDLQRVAAKVAAHAAHGEGTMEQAYRLKDGVGRWRWIRDFTVVHRDPGGAATHFEGYIFDDSRRLEAERDSARHQADLARLLRFSREALQARTLAGLLEAACAELRERIGTTDAWLVVADPGAPRRGRVLAAAGPAFAAGDTASAESAVEEALLERALAAGEPLLPCDSRARIVSPPFGEPSPATLWAGGYAASESREFAPHDVEFFRALVGLVALAFGRILADQEGRAAQARLRQVEKLEAVGQLAGGVAHNFNNSLTVILGHASLLLDAASPGSQQRAGLEAILRAGEGSAKAVRQLLQFARPQPLGGRERTDPGRTVADFGKMLRAVLDESIRLAVRCEDDLPQVETEAGALPMILMNLVLNARDAMEGGGLLTIRAATERSGAARWLRLEVEDDGCGMDAAVQARIFEPFFTTKGERGTGLGLSAVFGAVTREGGTVEVRSAPGRGSRFTIRLPEAAPAPPVEPRAPRPRAPGAARRVLVVEDEESVRLLAARALRSAGYRVEGVPHASAALELLARGEGFDLVLSDVVMPGMDGIELAQRLAAQPRAPAVLLMSGYPGRDGEARLPPSVRGLLRKPFASAHLVAAVERALNAPHGSSFVAEEATD